MSDPKQVLRERMRAARAAIAPGDRSRLAALVEERLFGALASELPGTVLLFYSFGSEVPTSTMSQRFLSEGSRLLLPYLRERAMEAAEVRPGSDLLQTEYGPKEPRARVAVDPGTVDVVVTPGLAFDRRGGRLGYGGGHFDRYLARLRPDALRVGIGFHVQLVDEVPQEPGDERVHLVVTDADTVDCRTAP